MADTPAVRQRRHRLHGRGDHSLCKGVCATAGDSPRDEVAAAVRKYLAAATITSDDLSLTAVLAVKAAEAVDQAATPGAVRVLNDILATHRRQTRQAQIDQEDHDEHDR